MLATKTILVCGSRTYEDRQAILDAFLHLSNAYLEADILYVRHGGAEGADALCESVVEELNKDGRFGRLITEVFLPDWSIGKRAGPARNREMLERGPNIPELVLAFGYGKGTSDTINAAIERGITVRRFS